MDVGVRVVRILGRIHIAPGPDEPHAVFAVDGVTGDEVQGRLRVGPEGVFNQLALDTLRVEGRCAWLVRDVAPVCERRSRAA